MPDIKPSYAELVVKVVREANEPLPFAEIMQRVNSLLPITTKNPKSTIRNAVTQSGLILHTGDGRYGWKYRLINGSVLRLPLSEGDLTQRRIIYCKEVRDALWPAFFESQKYNDRLPVQLQLPNGKTTELTLEFLGVATWGTPGSSEFWDWLGSVNAQPGDDLLFRVSDGEARQYAVVFQPQVERDEAAIAERNQQMIQAIIDYKRRNHFVDAIWEISSRLLATGAYKHPVPPDPLEQILTDELNEPDELLVSLVKGWLLAKEPEVDPLIASLLDQIGDMPARRRLKKEAAPTSAAKQVYQLKVTLKGTHPPVWRRIQVLGDISLPRLHAVLQIAMGWTNSHLHGFEVNGRFYSEPDPDGYDLKVMDERQVRLSQIAAEVGAHFMYEYDFGDSWEHDVVVEQILSPEKEGQTLRCLGGKRACPPEDVGGVGGYAEFLAAMRDRRHPEHTEWMQWAGEKFDPEVFEVDRVNQLLQSLEPRVEKRRPRAQK
jgi:hypothetical protein